MIPFTSPRVARSIGLRRSGGFTLTELLAVVCILLILFAIMFPAMESWSNHSKSIKCASNLRQAGILVQVITADSGNKLRSFFGGNSGQLWSKQLVDNGYITREGALKTLRCPYGKTEFPTATGTLMYWEAYGMPVYREELVWDTESPNIRNTTLYPARISKPAEWLLLADSIGATSGNQTFRISNLYGTRDRLSLRHRNKANGFFLDGHMEQLDKTRAVELGMEELIQPEE